VEATSSRCRPAADPSCRDAAIAIRGVRGFPRRGGRADDAPLVRRHDARRTAARSRQPADPAAHEDRRHRDRASAAALPRHRLRAPRRGSPARSGGLAARCDRARGRRDRAPHPHEPTPAGRGRGRSAGHARSAFGNEVDEADRGAAGVPHDTAVLEPQAADFVALSVSLAVAVAVTALVSALASAYGLAGAAVAPRRVAVSRPADACGRSCDADCSRRGFDAGRRSAAARDAGPGVDDAGPTRRLPAPCAGSGSGSGSGPGPADSALRADAADAARAALDPAGLGHGRRQSRAHRASGRKQRTRPLIARRRADAGACWGVARRRAGRRCSARASQPRSALTWRRTSTLCGVCAATSATP
jgi:hypothetical protein